MLNFILLIAVFIIALLVSRNNFRKRSEELKKNLEIFNREIKDHFLNLSDKNQDRFLCQLDDKFKYSLQSILKDTFNYGNNAWAIQQQIADQQELLLMLNKFITDSKE